MELKIKVKPEEGVIVEYTLLLNNEEAKQYCDYPNNEIKLRLYSIRDKGENNIAYYNARVGFTKYSKVSGLQYDYCKIEIVIGIDERHLEDSTYIRNLIRDLLRQQFFTTSKINLSSGTYTFSSKGPTGEEVRHAGNYVGQYEVREDGEYQKVFDYKYGEFVYNSLEDQYRENQKRENYAQQISLMNIYYGNKLSELYDEYHRRYEEYLRETSRLAKEYGIHETLAAATPEALMNLVRREESREQ